MKTIQCKAVSKAFEKDDVIHEFSYEFEEGNMYVIYGVSGSGKSTLLNMLGGLDKPSQGTITYFQNGEIDHKNQMMLFRKRIGYLFQNYALIDDKTVKQNLLIALEYSKSRQKEEQIKKALERVGLSGYIDKKIFTLSGGEQQRVALARILLKENDIILADEPTGNLDAENAEKVLDVFRKLKDENKTIIIATHDDKVLSMADEKILLKKR